jgi:type II secretory pathway component PulF
MSEKTSKRSQVWMVVLLVLHAVCGVFILWLLLKLVPGYEKIFKDFNTKLPDLTIMVINLSAWFGRFWYIVLPGLAAGDIAVMLSLNGTGRIRLMTAWGVLVWLTEMLLIGLILQATMVPLNELITNLSGGK